MEGTPWTGATDGTDSLVASFVRGLEPDAGVPTLEKLAPEELATAGAGLPAGAAGWAVALGRLCSDATRRAQGEHAAQLAEDDTRHAIEGSMLALLRFLCGDSPVPVLNEWQLTIARTMARLDWPYERYVAGLRLAQDMALEALLARAVRWGQEAGRPALLLAVTHGVASFFDDSVRAVITEFLAERQRAITRSVAERRRLVAALIAGRGVPADVAVAALGIDLPQHHLALVVWRPAVHFRGDDPPEPPVGAAGTGDDAAGWSKDQLELAVNRAAGLLRAPATLTMSPDEVPSDLRGDALACWLTSPVPFPARYLDRLTDLCAAHRGVRVAAGVPGRGPAGFRRSHLAAVDAYRVARTTDRDGVTGYAEVGALALLTADPERAGWFVSGELGPLAEPGRTLEDLRVTALCYLDTGRNLIETARRLNVHRNTVVYRVAKIERLLGRPLGERPFATQAALTLAAERAGRMAPGAGAPSIR